MSVLDFLRTQNSIEADMSPDTAPALAAPGAPGLAAARTGGAAPAVEDPPSVASAYYIERVGSERRYYGDLQGKQLAFKADKKAITTKQEDKATVSSMLDVAQAAGWTSLHVRGTTAFKREAWVEAQARGLAVKGYEPTADDRRDVATRRDAKRAPAVPTAAEAIPTPGVAASVALAPATAPDTAPTTQPLATPAKPRKARAASQAKAADGAAEGQVEQKRQVEREPVAETAAPEPKGEQKQPAERTAEAKREGPAAKAEGEAQKYPNKAREPWMEETGGLAALAPTQQASAERSHGRWLAAGTAEKPRTMGLEEYVGHVQGKQAEAREKQAKAEEKRADAADLDARHEALEASRDRGPSDPQRIERFADQIGRALGRGHLQPAAAATLIAEHVREHAVTSEPDKLRADLTARMTATAAETSAERGERGVEAKAREGAEGGEAKPAPVSRASADAARPNATTKLSPAGAKALAFLEERIETQMSKISADLRADLRAHAAQAIGKREAEVGPIKLPTAAPRQKQAAKQEQGKVAPKRQESGGEHPAQVQQPRMGMG